MMTNPVNAIASASPIVQPREQANLAVRGSITNFGDDDSPRLVTVWGSSGMDTEGFLAQVLTWARLAVMCVVIGTWSFLQSGVMKNLPQVRKEILDKLGKTKSEGVKIVVLQNIDALLRNPDDPTFNAFGEFEREVVHALMKRPDVLLLMTSQIEIGHWRTYDVRSRHINLHLSAYGADEMPEKFHGLRADLYNATLGFPAALHEAKRKPALTSDEIAQKSADVLLAQLNDDLKRFTLRLSLLFAFDISTIDALTDSNPAGRDWYGEQIAKIDHLLSHGLIRWDVGRGKWLFSDGVARRLLARSFRETHTQDAERYHRSFADRYADQVRERLTPVPLSVLAALYHTAFADKHEGPKKVCQACCNWIIEHQQFLKSQDPRELIGVWETGGGDESVVAELHEVLGADGFIEVRNQLIAEASPVKRRSNRIVAPPKPHTRSDTSANRQALRKQGR